MYASWGKWPKRSSFLGFQLGIPVGPKHLNPLKGPLGLCSSSSLRLSPMGTEPKSSRSRRGVVAPSPKPRAGKKSKRQRPNSILLADLFLWINVVDECLYHPVGAFDRAAMTEGYGSLGNVVNRIEKLEERFGQLFRPNKLSSRNRSGVPTPRGAALAEIFMLIELMFHWASTLEKSGSFSEVRRLKEFILYLVPRKASRVPDSDDLISNNSRIGTSRVWSNRMHKTGLPHNPKRMSEWESIGKSPVKSQARLSSKTARSSR
jgi:hypothetical protein